MGVQVIGLEEATALLLDVPRETRNHAVRAMAQYVYDHAQRGADKHTKTGALLQSLYSRPIAGGREIGHDPQRAPHARFVHWGTRPHIIRPRSKKALRWVSGNGYVFARFVRHPGYAGDPWLIRAADDAVRNFDRLLRGS